MELILPGSELPQLPARQCLTIPRQHERLMHQGSCAGIQTLMGTQRGGGDAALALLWSVLLSAPSPTEHLLKDGALGLPWLSTLGPRCLGLRLDKIKRVKAGFR